MQGFISRNGTPPGELLLGGRAEAGRYGVGFLDDRVVDAASGFALTLADGRIVHAVRLVCEHAHPRPPARG
jgi:hypothetical protein